MRYCYPRKTVSKIVNERCAITPDMALRLSRAFDTTPDLWLGHQLLNKREVFLYAQSHGTLPMVPRSGFVKKAWGTLVRRVLETKRGM